MSVDLELEAMKVVSGALEGLDEAARTRVIAWALSAYADSRKMIPAPQSELVPPGSAATKGVFRDFADLFDAASPETETDKALVAAYWFQLEQGQEDWDAQTLHDALKDLGQGITNITRALTRAQEQKPALVRQLQKAGKTRQARKKYRLTTQGVRAVQARLSSVSGNGIVISGHE